MADSASDQEYAELVQTFVLIGPSATDGILSVHVADASGRRCVNCSGVGDRKPTAFPCILRVAALESRDKLAVSSRT